MDRFKTAQAKNDAARWAESMVDYGEGSRIRRQNLERELRRKRGDPEYNEAFISELDRIDNDEIFYKLQNKKSVKNTVKNLHKIYREGKRIYKVYKENRGLLADILETLANRM